MDRPSPAPGDTHPSALLEFERSGGFAGLTLTAALDAEQLDPSEREAVRRHLVQPPRHHHEGSAQTGGPDSFRYRLALVQGSQRWSASFGERELPADLLPLVRRLSARAAPG